MKRRGIYFFLAIACLINTSKAVTTNKVNDKNIEAIYGLWSSKNDKLFEKISIQKDGLLEIIKSGVNLGKVFKITDYKNGILKGQGFDHGCNPSSGFSFEIKLVNDNVIEFTLHRNNENYNVRLNKEAGYESGAIFAK